MIWVGVGDFLDHRRVYKGGGYGNKALNVDDHASVSLDAHKHALGTGKRAADDAHTLALGKIARVGIEKDEFLVVGACHLDEVFSREGTVMGLRVSRSMM